MTYHGPKPPFPDQAQPMPGSSRNMSPHPDYGEASYKGSGRLAGKKAIITAPTAGSDVRSRLPSPAKVRTSWSRITTRTRTPGKPNAS